MLTHLVFFLGLVSPALLLLAYYFGFQDGWTAGASQEKALAVLDRIEEELTAEASPHT